MMLLKTSHLESFGSSSESISVFFISSMPVVGVSNEVYWNCLKMILLEDSRLESVEHSMEWFIWFILYFFLILGTDEYFEKG